MWPLRTVCHDFRRVKGVSRKRLECDWAVVCWVCLEHTATLTVSLLKHAADDGIVTGHSSGMSACHVCYSIIEEDVEASRQRPLTDGLVQLAKRSLLSIDEAYLTFARRPRDGVRRCESCQETTWTVTCTVDIADFGCTEQLDKWVSYCAPCQLGVIGRFREGVWRREAAAMGARVHQLTSRGQQLAGSAVPEDLVWVIWRLMCGLIDLDEAVANCAEVIEPRPDY